MNTNSRSNTQTNNYILRDKLNVLMGNYNLIAYSNFVVSALTVYVLYDLIENKILLGWLTCVYLGMLVRLLVKKRFIRENPLTNARLSYWSNIFTLLSFISGVTWAYGAWYFVLPQHPHLVTFIAVTWIGMTAGTIGSQGSHFTGFLAYSIPCMLALSLKIFFIGSTNNQILAFFALSLTLGFIGFARSNNKTITESLRLKYENSNLINQLEDKNTKLSEQISRAKEANQQKSQFLAASSHDLRQPLQSLTLFSEVLKNEISDKESLNTLNKMTQSISALNTLLSTLLDVSRLDAGDIKINKSNINLSLFFNRLADNFQKQANKQNIQLKFLKTNAWVYTDEVLLNRCMNNLITNALLHSNANKVLVGVKRMNGKLLLMVIDNGVGIPHSEYTNIFKEFQQLNNTERDRRKGLGLGLAIVKRTTELLEIPLKLDSRVAKGSAFSIELPITRKFIEVPKSKPAFHNLNSTKVLFIDDEKDIREAIEVLLSSWGATIKTAADKNDLIGQLRDGYQPDLIISDYRLPGSLTGVQLIKWLDEQYNINSPAMIITGDTDPVQINEIRDSGLKLLHKPISATKLRYAINQLLESKIVASKSTPTVGLY